MSAEHEITFLFPHPSAAFMRAAELEPDYKRFVMTERVVVTVTDETVVNESWFRDLFEKTANAGENRILGAVHDGELHLAEGIKVLSDGRREFFIMSAGSTRSPARPGS